jgi:hypothetical protein
MSGTGSPIAQLLSFLFVFLLLYRYRAMFKPSARCVPPHINADVLRNQLYSSQVCEIYGIQSDKDLTKLLLYMNKRLGSLPPVHWPLKSRYEVFVR